MNWLLQKVRSSIYNGGRRSGRGGGALASKCNAAGEIFQIAAIMNGFTLVGVAVSRIWRDSYAKSFICILNDASSGESMQSHHLFLYPIDIL